MVFTGIVLLDLLSVITAVLAVGYAYLKWTYQYWKRRNIPYIKTSSLLGNFQSSFGKRKDVGGAIVKVYQAAKPNGWRHVGVYGFASPLYVPLDLEIIKHIMTKDFDHFVSRGLYVNEKDDPLRAHLFSLSGKKVEEFACQIDTDVHLW
ncbi:hypothetical protein NQ318_005488 [Aromia moschata]|uniref:Cytochrome P450 n=1 Tax=Aromia moschata TaxID=1265417 RepID=A0AAV8XS55_9CUCU|nr:hypothetical protein NQ318_005488 [Aromia moschata]